MQSIKDFVINFKANMAPLMKGLQGASSGFNSLAAQVTKLGGIIGVALGGGALVNTMSKLGDELQNFQDLTGLSATKANELGKALEHFGGSTQDAMSDLKSLQQAMRDSVKYQGALVEARTKFRVYISNQGGELKDQGRLIKELASQFKRLSASEAVALGKTLGLSDAMVRGLRSSSRSLDEVLTKNKTLGSLTEDEIKNSKEFNSMLKDMRFMFEKLSMVILNGLMPPFRWIHKIFTKAWEYLTATGFRLVKVIGAIVAALVVMKALWIGISIAVNAALWPIGLIVLAVILIVLIVEDIWTFFQGGESITGKIVAKFKEWYNESQLFRRICDGLATAWQAIKNAVMAVVDWFKKLDLKAMINDIGAFFEKWTSLGTYTDAIAAGYNGAKESWNNWWNGKPQQQSVTVNGNNNTIGNQNSSSTVNNNMAPATANQGRGQLSQAGR